jgi:hypothetical protein
MSTILKTQVTVQEDGRIEIESSEFREGESVVVTVVPIETETTEAKLTDMWGSGTGLFKSAEEIDAFIREERESWHR